MINSDLEDTIVLSESTKAVILYIEKKKIFNAHLDVHSNNQAINPILFLGRAMIIKWGLMPYKNMNLNMREINKVIIILRKYWYKIYKKRKQLKKF